MAFEVSLVKVKNKIILEKRYFPTSLCKLRKHNITDPPNDRLTKMRFHTLDTFFQKKSTAI